MDLTKTEEKLIEILREAELNPSMAARLVSVGLMHMKQNSTSGMVESWEKKESRFDTIVMQSGILQS